MEERELDLAIGPGNRAHYKELFRRYAQHGAPNIDFCIPGLAFGLFWFMYRKINFVAAPALLVLLVLKISMSPIDGWPYMAGLGLFLHVLGGLFGRQLYWAKAKRLLYEAQRRTEGDARDAFIRQYGGTFSVFDPVVWRWPGEDV